MTGRFLVQGLDPLPLPDPSAWNDSQVFQSSTAADLAALDGGLAQLDAHLADASAGSASAAAANVNLADDITAGAAELGTLIQEQSADSVDSLLTDALAREAAADANAQDVAAMALPPDFTFDVFDLVAPPSASGLASLPLPGQTGTPPGSSPGAPPLIFITPAAGASQVPAYLSQGLATVAGVVGTLVLVADAFLVFKYLTSENFSAALAAYDAATKKWAASDPIGFAIWYDNQQVAKLKAQQQTGVGGNAAYLQIQVQIDRLGAALDKLHQFQYYGG